MNAIKQYIDRITGYRDNLIISFKEELEQRKYEFMSSKQEMLVFQPEELNKFFAEIATCNAYLDFLHQANKYYAGTPIDTRYKKGIVITTAEEYIAYTAQNEKITG